MDAVLKSLSLQSEWIVRYVQLWALFQLSALVAVAYAEGKAEADPQYYSMYGYVHPHYAYAAATYTYPQYFFFAS